MNSCSCPRPKITEDFDEEIGIALCQECKASFFVITHTMATEAKEKFKTDFFAKDQDRYNAVGIGINILHDYVETETEQLDEIFECFVKVYLFEDGNVDGLPNDIDGVNIKYFVYGKDY